MNIIYIMKNNMSDFGGSAVRNSNIIDHYMNSWKKNTTGFTLPLFYIHVI